MCNYALVKGEGLLTLFKIRQPVKLYPKNPQKSASKPNNSTVKLIFLNINNDESLS